MIRLLSVAPLLAPLLAPAGDSPQGAPMGSPITRQELSARVPSYPNTSCPIMGKPVSNLLYADTDYGRIWVCCKGCIAEIHADPALAHRTAYPAEQRIQAERCIVTGKPLREDSPEVVLQGKRFRVADQAAVAAARKESQTILARLMEPALVEVGNAECPIDGKPVVANAFVVIDGRLVRLSAPKHARDAAEAPAKTLKRALELARKSR